MIERHLPLVTAVAARFGGRGERNEDLVQVGSIGLINAVDRYDPARGTLPGFARAHIAGEIRRHLRDRASLVRVPRAVVQRQAAVKRTQRRLASRLGREPAAFEVARAAGVPLEEVAPALAAATPLELDEELAALGGGVDEYGEADARLLVATAARALDARKRQILHLRFFCGLSQRDIARELGLSQPHVCRLLEGALEEMRASLDADMPAADLG